MTRFQRIENIILGIVMLAASLVVLAEPEDGLVYISVFLCISLGAMGARYLIYYFRMARNMVGGKAFLFVGILFLDLSLLTYSIADEPRWSIAFYLLGFHVFSGAVNIFKAIKEKQYRSPSWRIDMGQGVGNILIFLFCLFHLRSAEYLTLIYCGGLFYSAVLRILSAFRRTAIVYIQ